MIPTVLGAALILMPIASFLFQVDWGNLTSRLGSEAAHEALLLSLWTSTISTLIILIVGLPMAWVLARYPFRGSQLLRSAITLPMVLPPVLIGIVLLTTFSRSAWLGALFVERAGVQFTFSPAGVILTQVFVALPFFVLPVSAAAATLDPEGEEGARTMGANGWLTARAVIGPQLTTAIGTGAVLAWARAIGEFGATATFVGSVQGRSRTLPLAIALHLESDPQLAYAMGVALMAICGVVLVLLRGHWLSRR